MRYYELLEVNLPAGWDLGGFWITDTGELIPVDHRQDIHHGDISLKHFADDSMRDENGEFDDYSRDMAQDIAYQNGWIRVSTSGNRAFALEWRTLPRSAARHTLWKLLKDDPVTYNRYELETDGYRIFDDRKAFLAQLRSILK